MNTDPITDMLNRLKNGQAVNKKTVDIPFSKMKYKIAKVLESEDFVESVAKKGRSPKKVLRVTLSYDENNEPAITETARVSKPGRRKYIQVDEIQPVKGGYGISILTTSKGIMSNKEARKANVGGELLCKIH